MAHEINMERLGESFSRKKHTNALKAEEDTSEEVSDDKESMGSSEDEEALLSRRLQRILAKKKYQSGRRHFKKNKDFKKPEGENSKRAEPICYECKKPGHIKEECLKLKKTEVRMKDSSRRLRRYKKKAMAATWDNSSDSDSESSSSEEEEEKANLAFMDNVDDKILVPRSAPFSTCTKADSDMMFWTIQNQSINMAEVISERMKFANAQIWDKKSKLNVSLPYAHLLTKIFQHYGITLVGAISVKMSQAIRSRNLKKSDFSLVDGVEEVVTPTSMVASIHRNVLDFIPSTQGEQEQISVEVSPEIVAPSHTVDAVLEDAPIQGEQEVVAENVAVGHSEDILMKDAPVEGEHLVEKEA
ncbi:hypothetical protein Taro_003061 [Colocasia esculenta]|uniref:CCHC-type domain-containing protein n=1 Tax=Colocasia esculenta TaxID=4460 RepID=A0A843TEE9_COLES|nr:hypothetical protein [Colocasia esculenta]